MNTPNLAAQREAQAKACARGVHDPGLALKSRLDIPDGSCFNSQGPQRDHAFLARECRACGAEC